MREKWGIWGAMILLFNLPMNGHADPISYNFVLIAETSGSFCLLFPPSINNNGTVAFLTTLRSGDKHVLAGCKSKGFDALSGTSSADANVGECGQRTESQQ